MAGTPVDEAFGITVVFGTSTLTFELMDFSWTGISREALETTHQGTPATPANKTGTAVQHLGLFGLSTFQRNVLNKKNFFSGKL